ncbi:hypothetical protein ANCCAN_21848 [Ancylostoma caninum]|uniref:Uncharacterized protein n=1 Tax=Ancylostoma caninum TaxID=29170 RepID=A0A368FBL8_ANCCA|nr:hypothetical protein ANCCAN_24692 [Ancylostoma caninum]RCN32351.1 hypothetical protein ANCCAN_21848 [Ancylostoma caninum]
MRLPDLLSAVTLNVVLALFSMVMAIVALGLLAFVLAKDSLQKDTLPTVRDKIKRHESVVVDFRNPSSVFAVPDHFLQLNTLMFQKKPRNNLITEMPAVPLSGMHMMSSTDGNRNVDGELTPIPAEAEDVVSNKVSSVLRAQRSASKEQQTTTHSPSSFVTDSGISDEDYSSDTTETHEDTSKTSTENPSREGSGWIEEKSTIEPLAQKIIVDLECGSEFSLC